MQSPFDSFYREVLEKNFPNEFRKFCHSKEIIEREQELEEQIYNNSLTLGSYIPVYFVFILIFTSLVSLLPVEYILAGILFSATIFMFLLLAMGGIFGLAIGFIIAIFLFLAAMMLSTLVKQGIPMTHTLISLVLGFILSTKSLLLFFMVQKGIEYELLKQKLKNRVRGKVGKRTVSPQVVLDFLKLRMEEYIHQRRYELDEFMKEAQQSLDQSKRALKELGQSLDDHSMRVRNEMVQRIQVSKETLEKGIYLKTVLDSYERRMEQDRERVQTLFLIQEENIRQIRERKESKKRALDLIQYIDDMEEIWLENHLKMKEEGLKLNDRLHGR